MNGWVSKSSEVLVIYGKLTVDTLTPRVRCGVRLNLYQDSCEKKEAPPNLFIYSFLFIVWSIKRSYSAAS